MTGRAAELAAVSALALVLTVVVAAPVLRAPSERIFGMGIVGRHHDPFTVMERFGNPVALGVYSQPLTDIAGALLARASGPVAAYNWLVLLTFPLSAAAAYVLARHLTLPPPGAAVAAIAFAFSPFHLAHAAYHPHIAQTQWVPLYLLALWRCMDEATPAAVVFLAFSIAAVTLSNFYGGLIAAVITPAAIAAYWFFKTRRQPGSLGRLAITIGSLVLIATGGVAYAWHISRVVTNRSAFAVAPEDLFRYSARWWSYVLPPIEHPVLGGIAAREWNGAGIHEGVLEQQVSLGLGLVALSFVALLAWVRSSRYTRPLATVPVLASVAVAAFVCSLSPEGTIGPFIFDRPSAYLYRWLPMFRSYGRFGVVVQLMAALLAGIGAERLWTSSVRGARTGCVALLLLAGAEYAVWPPTLWRDVLPTMGHRWVARRHDRIRALDCVPLTPESRSVQWLSGYRISLLDERLDDCTAPDLADQLSLAGYTHLLVRRETSAGERFARQPPPEGLKMAARFDDSAVFALMQHAPIVRTVKTSGFYAREYDETWAWQWMGRQAEWTIVSRSDRPFAATLEVEIEAFHQARRLQVLLDAREVQTLMIDERRAIIRLGPLSVTPGAHNLEFRAVDAPAVAADLINNGDPRPLSFAFGAWHWLAEDEQP
jgi:hypothetical protein